MLFTVRTTHVPATDLGYLLEKSPFRTQSFGLSFGRAHVTFPEASDAGCTMALYVDVDPLELRAQSRDRGEDGLLAQYVNDRPYVASSHLAVALGSVLRSAMAGRSRERPELASAALPLTATVSPLPARGGIATIERLFVPLGYQVEASTIPLDPRFPSWGDSPYVRLTLRAEVRLSDLLTHLSVLIPVLDAHKHYYVGTDEVDKLLARGDGWLASHPERELIARRYLKRSAQLTRMALARLSALDADPDPDARAVKDDESEEALERPQSLNEARMEAVMAILSELGADRVLDVGCGEGRLIGRLLRQKPPLSAIGGMDVSLHVLERAEERLKLDRMPPAQRERLTLFHGSLVYGDSRLKGWDVLCAIDVIEHLDVHRLASFERAIFAEAAPRAVVVTTPNREHNVRYALAPDAMRHADHRFEWTRAEGRAWAEAVAARRGYAVAFREIGTPDAEVGAPTQCMVFTRAEGAR